MDPASSFAQSGTHLAAFTLQQVYLARTGRDLWSHTGNTATSRQARINTPFAPENICIKTCRPTGVRQQLGHIKTDATSTNDCDFLPYLGVFGNGL